MGRKAKGQYWRFGSGIVKLSTYGTYSVFVSLGHGKCRRKNCKTLAEARAWIEAGDAALDPVLAVDAAKAAALLPAGVSLEAAARCWIEINSPIKREKLSRSIEEYISSCAISVRNRTLQSYAISLKRFCTALGDPVVADISLEAVEDFVSPFPPSVRNGMIRNLSAFFSWASKRKIISSNPASLCQKARIERKTPSVLTAGEIKNILESAVRYAPNVVPAIVLGAFAGVRPQEVHKLRPSNFGGGFVRITGDITKDHDARTVPISANLEAWLTAFPLPIDGVSETALKRFKAQASISWPQDSLRHSYATYRYELTHDAAQTAAELGHKGTEVFFKHYRALAEPGSGKIWFAIFP